jgi:hypothetical protein
MNWLEICGIAFFVLVGLIVIIIIAFAYDGKKEREEYADQQKAKQIEDKMKLYCQQEIKYQIDIGDWLTNSSLRIYIQNYVHELLSNNNKNKPVTIRKNPSIPKRTVKAAEMAAKSLKNKERGKKL